MTGDKNWIRFYVGCLLLLSCSSRPIAGLIRARYWFSLVVHPSALSFLKIKVSKHECVGLGVAHLQRTALPIKDFVQTYNKDSVGLPAVLVLTWFGPQEKTSQQSPSEGL